MVQPPIIRRTEKLRELTSLINDRRIVFVSAFFYSGKTVLLEQLCHAWNGHVLRFAPDADDWTEFMTRAASIRNVLLVIDGIESFTSAMTEELSALLSGLGEGRYAVLAGRAQLPMALHSLCSSGIISMLGRDFMMFDEEEVVQLFLEYGIELLPSDVQQILEQLWGWVFGLHILAQQILRHGRSSMNALIDDTRSDIKRILVADVILAFPGAATDVQPVAL